MAVDDAGTLDPGGAKVEFGWRKDGPARGADIGAGFSPIESLELGATFTWARDRSESPEAIGRGVDVQVKWVPVRNATGLSAGLEGIVSRGWLHDGPDAREAKLLGLCTWAFAEGPLLHVNGGYRWTKAGDERTHGALWGVGLDVPVVEDLHVTLETYGARRERPDNAVGLRWQVAHGWKLSAAFGRGNDRRFANAGVAVEF